VLSINRKVGDPLWAADLFMRTYNILHFNR
jgi:hypothetical protein